MSNQYYGYEDQVPPPATDFDSQLLSIEQALAHASPEHAQTLVDEAGSLMGQMYDDAQARGDSDGMLAISQSWERVQALKLVSDASTATAHAAVAGMKSAIKQRDKVAGELDALIQAIDDGDTSNPHVAGLVDAVEEQQMDSGMWIQCPGCDAINQGFPVNHDAVNYFVGTLLNDAELVSDTLKQELATFIHDWSKRAMREEKAVFEARGDTYYVEFEDAADPPGATA